MCSVVLREIFPPRLQIFPTLYWIPQKIPMYFDFLAQLLHPATKKSFNDSATVMPHGDKVLLMKTHIKRILHLTNIFTIVFYI